MLIPMIETPVWSVQVDDGSSADPRVAFQGSEKQAKERFAKIRGMIVRGAVLLVDPHGECQALFAFGAARRTKR